MLEINTETDEAFAAQWIEAAPLGELLAVQLEEALPRPAMLACALSLAQLATHHGVSEEATVACLRQMFAITGAFAAGMSVSEARLRVLALSFSPSPEPSR